MTQRCSVCRPQFDAAMRAAGVAVHKAIRHGALTPAAEHECVDCNRKAFDWDHRDYRQPLVVEPVCRSCNFARGPALYDRLITSAAIAKEASDAR